MDGGNQNLPIPLSTHRTLGPLPIGTPLSTGTPLSIGIVCALAITMLAQQLVGQTDELTFVSDALAFLDDEESENGPLTQPDRVQLQTGPQQAAVPQQAVPQQTRPLIETRNRVPLREGRPKPVTTPIMPKRLPAPAHVESSVGAHPRELMRDQGATGSASAWGEDGLLTSPKNTGRASATLPVIPQIRSPAPMQRLASLRPSPPAGPRTFYGPPSPPSLGSLNIDAPPLESLQKWPGDPDVMWVLQDDGAVASSSSAASPDESYGAEPVDRSLQFLRGQAVLLGEGQWQMDYGLAYSVDSSHVPALDGINIVRADVERRQFFMPLGVRYGWDNRTQIFANLPIGLAHTEFGTPITDLNTNTFDIGDLNVGVSRLIQQGSYYCPDIIFTVDASMPLGDSTVPPDFTSADMSCGVWSAATSLLFVHQYDPMVVYWGGGFRYNFEATHGGISYDPGHEINYQMGTGFAVNDRMTLGAAVIGSFITEAEFNDVGVGGIRDSLRGRLSLTLWRNCRIVEPFAEWGMTEDAPDARLGVVWTR